MNTAVIITLIACLTVVILAWDRKEKGGKRVWRGKKSTTGII